MIEFFDDKDPDEVDFFNIDFVNEMPPDDTIESIVQVVVDGGDGQLTIDQFAFLGKVVSGRWQSGTFEATYLITARVTTVNGRTLDKSGYVTIAST